MTAHRQCSECKGCDHHWTEPCTGAPIDENDPAAEYGCKHCDAEADMCLKCGGFDDECGACDGTGIVARIELEIIEGEEPAPGINIVTTIKRGASVADFRRMQRAYAKWSETGSTGLTEPSDVAMFDQWFRELDDAVMRAGRPQN